VMVVVMVLVVMVMVMVVLVIVMVLVVEAARVVRHLAASRGKRHRGACFLARSGQLECSTT